MCEYAGLKTALVGLPNVGKSTLFNALVGSAAAKASNFPFCTIEPNHGKVSVTYSHTIPPAVVGTVVMSHLSYRGYSAVLMVLSMMMTLLLVLMVLPFNSSVRCDDRTTAGGSACARLHGSCAFKERTHTSVALWQSLAHYRGSTSRFCVLPKATPW
jgi:hypothetical protein